MDLITLAAALKLAPKKTLPQTSAEDAGEMLVVGSDGNWTKGAATTATISASQISGDDYGITVQEGSD